MYLLVINEGRTNLPRIVVGPVASRGVSVPVFRRKPIATCDFSVGGPCVPYASARGIFTVFYLSHDHHVIQRNSSCHK